MISETEYKKRRETLAEQLKNNSLSVLFSAVQQIRSNDTEYVFRQNSNFYYMTGFKEDNATLVFLKKKGKTKTILFVQKKDKLKELWTGKRLGVKQSKKRFLIDKVYAQEDFETKLKEYMQGITSINYDFNSYTDKAKVLHAYAKDMLSYANLAKPIEQMRLYKSPTEIALIRKAIAITKEAHHRAMHMSKKCNYEYELQAEIEYVFKKNAALSDAYTSIVAGGNNANTLHYIDNNKPLHHGDLILIDAGCEYNYYASDITRSIPTSGKFTQAQKELYEMVLEVELAIIKMIQPNIKRTQLQKKSEELLCAGMVKLGILKGDVKKLLKKQKHKKYYPHGIGHWMGIDVHDQAPYKDENGKELLLQSGMVMTIEPGVYIEKDDTNVPLKYRGIGIRIEDDILVTDEGHENLSQGIAKTINEIEKYA